MAYTVGQVVLPVASPACSHRFHFDTASQRFVCHCGYTIALAEVHNRREGDR